MTKEEVLNSIELKDWVRARTVKPGKIMAMFNAITDNKKLLRRSLAFYYVYKYIFNFQDGENAPEWAALIKRTEDNLAHLVDLNLISQEVCNELKECDVETILPYVSDSLLHSLFEQTIDSKEEEPSLGKLFNLSEDVDLNETYSEEELENLVNKVFNQQKILNIYRRSKYGQKQLFAHTKCVNCGREKRVFLSNLVTDPEKYGSCICSDTNVESRLDHIHDLYDNSKRLSSNTSGYTGVTYVPTYAGEPYDKWRAYIDIDNKRIYLGDFDAKAKAVKARKAAAEKGIKWYREHKNEFLKQYRRKQRRYRNRLSRTRSKKLKR